MGGAGVNCGLLREGAARARCRFSGSFEEQYPAFPVRFDEALTVKDRYMFGHEIGRDCQAGSDVFQ